jgi:hypothetical protein
MVSCNCVNKGSNNRPEKFRSIFYFGTRLAPWAVLLLIPKCPLCIVAYVAMLTGIGVSISTAANLRLYMIAATLVILAYLLIRPMFKRRHLISC